MSDRRFLLAFHPGREEAVTTAGSIAARLLQAGVIPVVLGEDRDVLLASRDGLDAVEPHHSGDEHEVELIMTLGGDGTILRAAELQREIGAAQERLSVLKAEWAYLNRPERLRELAELNYDSLGLLPLRPDQFGRVDEVAYPQPASLNFSSGVDVSTMTRESYP